MSPTGFSLRLASTGKVGKNQYSAGGALGKGLRDVTLTTGLEPATFRSGGGRSIH